MRLSSQRLQDPGSGKPQKKSRLLRKKLQLQTTRYDIFRLVSAKFPTSQLIVDQSGGGDGAHDRGVGVTLHSQLDL